MTAPRRSSVGEAQLAFDAISIEGGLLGADWLGKVAQLEATAQTTADYRVPKGLHLRDEIARCWRIAQACFQEMDAGRVSGADARVLAERFVEALLRDAFSFTSLVRAEPRTIGERVYPVRFFALGERVPVIVAPMGAGLDAPRTELGDGRRRRSAFGLLQEVLNAHGAALWGLASDGLLLRVARDNASLTRPAWIEADLARIFTEGLYPDFAALWLIVHESRFGRVEDPAGTSPLESWRETGRKEGTQAREKLRKGFDQALEILGQGFLGHSMNTKLWSAFRAGQLTKDRYYEQLLRLVYRLIFLLTVEERGLLHSKSASDGVSQLYADGYALHRLRDKAIRRSAHDQQGDLWEGVKIVFRGLADGEPRLGLPALAGLFAPEQCPDLDAARTRKPRAARGTVPSRVAARAFRTRSRELARHGSRRARLCVRRTSRTRPPDHKGRPLVLLCWSGRKPRPCAQDDGQLLHARRARAGAARERARSGRQADRGRPSGEACRCAARAGDCRPCVRLRALPARCGASARRSCCAHPRGGHSHARGLPACASRGRPALHLRR